MTTLVEMLAWEEIPEVPTPEWRAIGCKCYSSDRKESYAVSQRQGIPQNHITQQTSHKRWLGGEAPEVTASAWTKSIRELGRKLVSCRVGEDQCFARWPGIGWFMWPELGASSGIRGIFFCRVTITSREGNETDIMAIRELWWWNLAFGGP